MVGTELKSKGGIAAVASGYYTAGIMSRQKIKYYPSHCDGQLSAKIKFYLKTIMAIILKIYRYKIVHVHMASKWSFRRLFIVLVIAKFFKKKRIIHLHGAAFNIYYNNASYVESFLIRYVFSDADRIIVLSEEWEKKIEHFCNKDKIVIIPNSVTLKHEKEYHK